MRKRVYLFELDSVRNSDSEIIRAFNTLYDEIVVNGNVVVMTMNQLVDSRGFFSLFADEKYHESLLALFESGALRISQYGDTRTVAQYLIGSIAPEKEFIYSALPLKSSQRRLAALIRRSLVYSDLSEIHDYLEGGQRTEDERKELFAEVREENGVKRVCPSALSAAEMRQILNHLYWLITAVLRISMLHDAYIPPRKKEEYAHFRLCDFVRIVLELENSSDRLWAEAMDVIRSLSCLDRNERSVYLRKIKEAADACGGDREPFMYAEAVINLCYNYTCEMSIADISKHYDVGELTGSGVPASFEADFRSRLSQDWNETQARESRYLKEETNHFEVFTKTEELADFIRAVRITGYVDYKEQDADAGPIEGYETQLKDQRRCHQRQIRHVTGWRFAVSILFIILAGCVSYGLDAVQNIVDSYFVRGIIGISIFVIFMFAAEAVTGVMSKYLKIPSLSEALDAAGRYLVDFKGAVRPGCMAYANRQLKAAAAAEQPAGIDKITYITPDRIKKYAALRKERGQFFEDPDNASYPLADVENAPFVQKILMHEADFGSSFGLVYHSRYNLMAVDPIVDANGGIFGYERILPAEDAGGVVILVKCREKFILLRQFRHALRGEQTAFPRGYLEQNEDPEKGARRELKEELGDPEIKSIVPLGRISPDSGLSASMPYAFAAEIEGFAGNPGHEGILSYEMLTEPEMRSAIAAGEINDGFTLSAYALYCAGKVG